MEERKYQREDIERYLLLEVPDLEIVHSQRIRKSRVDGEVYEIWDVRTTTDQFWVITNLTNYYDQKTLPSFDAALSLHIGLMRRMIAKQFRDLPAEADGAIEVAWAKFQRAVETHESGLEAEDFQAVGLQCRESLIALVDHFKEHLPELQGIENPPMSSDFKEWAYLASDVLAKDRVRSYLKEYSKSCWDLSVWLQHYKTATHWDSELVLDAISHLVKTYGVSIQRHLSDGPTLCPNCKSYQIDRKEGEDPKDKTVWNSNYVCARCLFEWDHTSQRFNGSSRKWDIL